MAPRSHSFPAMATVLVVDDEPPILELVRFTLEDEQIRIVEASDGAAALETARTERPDLILLDVQMPRMNGFEVCRRIRQDPALSHTRIVMLTAADQEADRARGLAAGADEYLAKPFSPLALLALVRNFLPEALSWPDT
ncbi:MAG TPA: response regulator [Candidatus Limnocylindrales bacterium]|nr:response regulator [Candidatus Limnocylindrales bacterium]